MSCFSIFRRGGSLKAKPNSISLRWSSLSNCSIEKKLYTGTSKYAQFYSAWKHYDWFSWTREINRLWTLQNQSDQRRSYNFLLRQYLVHGPWNKIKQRVQLFGGLLHFRSFSLWNGHGSSPLLQQPGSLFQWKQLKPLLDTGERLDRRGCQLEN